MNKIRICMLVTNPLIKDPRVQRELNSAQQSGFEVIFIGSQNEFYNKEFLNKLPFITDIILFNEKIHWGRDFIRMKQKQFANTIKY